MKLVAPLYVVLPGIIAFHLFCLHQHDGQEYVIHQLSERPALLVQGEDNKQHVFEQDKQGIVAKLNKQKFTDLSQQTGQQLTVGEDQPTNYTIVDVVPAKTIVSLDESGAPQLLPGGDPEQQLGMTQADKSYGRLAKQVVPPWLLGFFAAVIFGAILSSFNSGLNSAATLFSVDIYKAVFRQEASEERMVFVGKVLGTLFALGAIIMAPLIESAPAGLFELMKRLAAFYNIPLLAVVSVGMFSRRTPSLAAWVAVAVGVVFYGFYGFYMDNHVLGYKLNFLHVAGINFVLLVAVMLAVTAIAPRKVAWEQTHSEDVDITPWKPAKLCGALILIAIALLYWTLSRFGQ